MNVAIIGVVPWREAMRSQAVVADFMVRVYGSKGGIAIISNVAVFG